MRVAGRGCPSPRAELTPSCFDALGLAAYSFHGEGAASAAFGMAYAYRPPPNIALCLVLFVAGRQSKSTAGEY